ncbi:MAG: hypothetical protein VKJ64_14480 [Leptolyngbyaceae bacterium]|nr:hypothetical protein [Leptolyngbyaceae bacterium]
MTRTGIILVGIGVNGAIALICSLCTWKLLQFRYTVIRWDHQLNTLEQELGQTLAQAPTMMLAGPQQIKQGRRQLRHLQTSLRSYYQGSWALIRVLQWARSLK